MHLETQADLAYPIVYLQGPGPGIQVHIDMASTDHGNLVFFGGDCAAIFTGATYGITDIIIDTRDGPPADGDLADWETVEEGTLTISAPLTLLPHPAAAIQSLEELSATEIRVPALDPGSYRLRVASRGRDVDRSDVSVRLQLWPTAERGGLRVIATGDRFDPRSLSSITPRHHVRTATSEPATATTATASPTLRPSNTVDVSHHSFLISGQEIDPTATYAQGSVFDAGDNLIAVHTGIASGPVAVVIERFDDDPLLDTGVPPIDLSAWENVDEVTVPCRTEMWVITLDGEIVSAFGVFGPSSSGTRTFRIAVRGRASNWDSIVDEPTEDYLVQTWSTSSGPSTITATKATDGIWPVSE
ncbi:hypothetical protein IA539_15565 [Gordonia sp. zg691]|uniref:hypothetical protein n=1 Tax=Gordonia jinghuaiqii TaxID=2758710 RepID=UPI00166264D4|nr:hypothetical protein [Gordonia jinghuaiqii]MBD0862617.1 hypothetical protein [Gordonia jinghuaiqii]